MTIQEILNRLNGVKKSGEGYIARCPAHEDKHQSLSVRAGDGGKILLNCHAGCSPEAVVGALGLSMRDLFDGDKPRQTPKKQVIATYTYPGGVQKLRYNDKSFAWRRPDGKGGWEYNRQGVPHSLYIQGDWQDAVIFCAEGEKDVNSLHALGLTAVSGEDGAGPGKWRVEYTRQLKGKVVCILPDHDQIGEAYAQEVAAALSGEAESVRVLDLAKVWPEIPEHGDISDMIATLGPKETEKRLGQLMRDAKEWRPAPPATVFDSFDFYSVPDLTEEERRPPEFIVDGIIPVGLTFIAGAPKIRKSFMALQIAIAVATGSTFLGKNTRQCDVAYLDLEGSKSRISQRTKNMSSQIPRNVFISNQIKERIADGLVDKLRSLHRERPSIRFFIIDTYRPSRSSWR